MVKIDIEMPTYCHDCPCCNGENGQCNITGNYTFDKRPFDCPLKEEKHAHWHFDEVSYECSACKEVYRSGYNYCPYCGAKMDEEENNE